MTIKTVLALSALTLSLAACATTDMEARDMAKKAQATADQALATANQANANAQAAAQMAQQAQQTANQVGAQLNGMMNKGMVK